MTSGWVFYSSWSMFCRMFWIYIRYVRLWSSISRSYALFAAHLSICQSASISTHDSTESNRMIDDADIRRAKGNRNISVHATEICKTRQRQQSQYPKTKKKRRLKVASPIWCSTNQKCFEEVAILHLRVAGVTRAHAHAHSAQHSRSNEEA